MIEYNINERTGDRSFFVGSTAFVLFAAEADRAPARNMKPPRGQPFRLASRSTFSYTEEARQTPAAAYHYHLSGIGGTALPPQAVPSPDQRRSGVHLPIICRAQSLYSVRLRDSPAAANGLPPLTRGGQGMHFPSICRAQRRLFRFVCGTAPPPQTVPLP